MSSSPSNQTSIGKRYLQRKSKRSVMQRRSRISDIVLAALTFFLGQTVSFVQSNHVEQHAKSYEIFSSAFAGKENGKGKGVGLGNGNGVGNGNGNGNSLGSATGNTAGTIGNNIGGSSGIGGGGLGNLGSGGSTSSGRQKTLSNGLPLPPGFLDKSNANAASSSASQGAFVRSLNPINKIPEFKADDEDVITNGIRALDEFDASEIDYLEEFSGGTDVRGGSNENMTGVALSVDLENRTDGEISVNAGLGEGTNGLAVGLAKQTGGDIGASGNVSVNASANANGNANTNANANANADANVNGSSGNNGLALGLEKQASGEIAVNANGNGNGNSGNNGLALGLLKQASGEIAVNANGNGVQARLDGTTAATQAAALAEEAGKNGPSSGSIFGPDGPPDTYSANEVLAENLEPAAIERAEALGFKIEEVNYGRSGEEDTYSQSGDRKRDIRISRLTVPEGMTVPQARDLLQRELPGQQFHLNRIYRMFQPAIDENDEKARKGKTRIDLRDLDNTPCTRDRCYGRQIVQWKDDLRKCASKLKIGIIDTHVDTKHKAFAGQNIHQETFVPAGRQVAESGHGTGVLALLAGRPDSNTPGLLPDADFFVASIFFAGDDGSVQTDTVSLLRAMHWMDRSGVQLVNLSFSGPKDSLLEIRFGKLRDEAGMVFAAAAGNEGLAADPSYPAAYSEVIAVTAVDQKMRIYPSANRGEYIDIAAPGVHIWTALPDSKAGYVSGTSFAAPFMTAMLAIQQPETLRMTKNHLLNQVRVVPLDANANNDSWTYGRGLLQAPSKCPTTPSIAKSGAPMAEVSLK